ncbi:unnamed protein product, partial [Effrenium voratum]
MYGCAHQLLKKSPHKLQLSMDEALAIAEELEQELLDDTYCEKDLDRHRRSYLKKRIQDDIATLKEKGVCPNMYDLYADLLPGRFRRTIFDAFNETYQRDWLFVVDECHSSLSAMMRPHQAHQTRVEALARDGLLRRNMYAAERSGPLSWEDLQKKLPDKVLYMSATPLKAHRDEGILGEEVGLDIRPTHILDPEIVEIRTLPYRADMGPEQLGKSRHDMADLIKTVRDILRKRKPADQVIINCISCLQADDVLHSFLGAVDGYKSGVLHGKRTSRENNLVLTEFQQGKLDGLVGSKMLVEGLDLPGVATVIVTDADSPGMLRT